MKTMNRGGRKPYVGPGTPATARQQEILRFLVARIREGRPASIREVMAHFGLRSPNSIVVHLVPLERRGLIEFRRTRHSEGGRRAKVKARSITLPGARLVLEYTDDEAGRRLREAVEGSEGVE